MNNSPTVKRRVIAPEIESRDRFEIVFGKDLSLKLFIRKLIGLDRNAAKLAFAQYLADSNFNANQIRFVENIFDYLTSKWSDGYGVALRAALHQSVS